MCVVKATLEQILALTIIPSVMLFQHYTRQSWTARSRLPLPPLLTQPQLKRLQGLNEPLNLLEVQQIYWPLIELLHQRIQLYQQQSMTEARSNQQPPYIIGIAGSVAAGKSTCARILQWLLSRWPQPRQVALVNTDGFLYSNQQLKTHNLMDKKGFPHSYHRQKLIQLMSDLKAGKPKLQVPLYSHWLYDIIPHQYQCLEQPEVVILEGLNVLQQRGDYRCHQSQRFMVDFLDFSLYIDAPEQQLKRWYIERFLLLRDSAFRDPGSYFYHYASLTDEQAVATASGIWEKINGLNLRQNILPTRKNAQLILYKGVNHWVEQIQLQVPLLVTP